MRSVTNVEKVTVYFVNQQEDDLVLLYTKGVYESFQEERMFGYIQHQSRTQDPKVRSDL